MVSGSSGSSGSPHAPGPSGPSGPSGPFGAASAASESASPAPSTAAVPSSAAVPSAAPAGGGSFVGWAVLVSGTVLLVSVPVDAALGDGFAWATLAFTLILLPQGARQVLTSHGDIRRADRLRPLTLGGAAVAAALCWAGLITDWARGHSTDWLVLAATVFLTLTGASWLGRVMLRDR